MATEAPSFWAGGNAWPDEPWIDAAAAMPTEGRLELVDAWTGMLDGLQVHRWYLHAQPGIDAHIAALHSALVVEGPMADETVPLLSTLQKLVPSGALLHLLVDTELPAWPEVLKGFERVSRKGWAPRVVDESACSLHEGVLVSATTELLRDRLLARAVERAIELSWGSTLGYLPALGAQVIVLGRDTPAQTLPQTIQISAAAQDAIELADQIVTGAACEWITAYIADSRARFAIADDAEFRWSNREHAVPLVDAVTEVFVVASRARFLAELAEDRRLLIRPDEQQSVSTLAEAAAADLRSIQDGAYAVAEAAHDLLLRESLVVTVPGPRRFERYERGSGAGQAE